ncbi:MAG: FG-GAP-like repeat-containing protein, partial [Planctomycetota bacterium]|nr:FG-GAP-like repeat-containing protein [Planctomycetota bacterium]
MFFALLSTLAPVQEPGWHTIQLNPEFTCEGASYGDVNGDGVNDVVAGPFWWAGPEFSARHRYYDGKVFETEAYSDHFFSWVRDFDEDGDNDILVIGFPGQVAHWYENPGAGEGAFTPHLIHDNVDNESPHFTDLDGDGREDLVCHSGGRLCWFSIDPANPRARWTRHDLSEPLGLGRFTHGMGVGDISGDGKPDVLLNTGVWVQPDALAGQSWQRVPFLFSRGQGGAQMLVTDVDGDGDGDVVTSLNAHRYGLSWFENRLGEDPPFVEHPIMGSVAGEHGCPIAVSELHALDLADVDGDGQPDVVTGKRWKSHNYGEPGSRDSAYLLWFSFERGEGGVTWTTHLIHDVSGVGVQVMAGDVDGDGRTDVVVGSKAGAHLHLQREDGARLALPEVAAVEPNPDIFPAGGVAPVGADGGPLNLDFDTGDLTHWTAEGEAFTKQPIKGDTVKPRREDMASDHIGQYWIGGYEELSDAPTGTLTSAPFELTQRYVAFLIAGGNHAELRVDLVDAVSNQRLISATGRNHEALRPTVLDLVVHVGKQVRVRLVDEHSGGWGHLNFDHLRLYAERPTFPDGLEVQSEIDVRSHAGQTPEEAAASMSVPAGFAVDLIVGEPDLFQPIAFTFDERGRLWVAEAHSYPQKRDDPEQAKDQLLIFEDTDGDGAFETRKVFATGLDLVSGLEVGYGGVFVGQAPELLFLPDRDGDDVPDGPPEVLLDGWGYQDTHETLNALLWGPDGWLYGCHGVFTHSRVGRPGTPDEERVPMNAGVWRYHPKTRDFEVFAWGSSNPWGLDFDDRGQPFITACVIPHLYHVIQGARYVRQGGSHFNPHVYADIPTIADHLHYVGSTPHSGNGRSDGAGGGHAHCGAMVYLGDAWPERYRDTLFLFNIHGNRMNNEVLVPSRSGYVGLHGEDLLLANDQWFRGINMRYGPDGQVYLIDWYDKQACHYVAEDIWNRTNGRLYRVRYGAGRGASVDLGAMDEGQLIELQDHANDWYVRTARRLLGERGLSEEGRLALLAGLWDTDARTTTRLRKLWALHVGGGLDPGTLARCLDDQAADVRAWAVQLACEDGAPTRG